MKKILVMLSIVLVSALSWAQNSSQGSRPASPKAEQNIAKEVRHEILMLPYYGVFDSIGYSVKGYDVTLFGQVTRDTLKHDAETSVKHIEGVEQVNNQIEVLPVSPNDERLRLAVFRAIYGDTALQRYDLGVIKPIHIVVKNGHVTLKGVVDNQGDKDIANIRANGVPGVFSVSNELQVGKG